MNNIKEIDVRNELFRSFESDDLKIAYIVACSYHDLDRLRWSEDIHEELQELMQLLDTHYALEEMLKMGLLKADMQI